MGDFSVMMLSWEFPPRVIGGIAPHVHELSQALSALGVEVFVVTCDFPGAKEYETINGVKVYRIDSYKFASPDFATWTSMMNVNLQVKATEILREEGERIHMLHAHDWLVANASVALKHLFRIPLVATIHSTEYGRRNGLHTDYQRMIDSFESWLTREAWRVICCSNYMASHINSILGTPLGNIEVIPNGIDASKFQRQVDLDGIRRRFASADERLVLFVGRLVYEKGAHLLVESIPMVLKEVNAKFVIVGEGYMKEQLIKRVKELGLETRAYVTGFLDEETVLGLFRVSDVVVIPSLYEPFGIVALEAMAARAPIVTTGAGGLGEIIDDEETGVTVYASPESIAWGVLRLLKDSSYAKGLSEAAYRKVVSEFEWQKIAERTKEVYKRVLDEYQAGKWKPLPLHQLPKV